MNKLTKLVNRTTNDGLPRRSDKVATRVKDRSSHTKFVPFQFSHWCQSTMAIYLSVDTFFFFSRSGIWISFFVNRFKERGVILFILAYLFNDHRCTVPSAAHETMLAADSDNVKRDCGWNSTDPTRAL